MSDMMPSLIMTTTELLNSLSPNLALALSEGLNADCDLTLERIEAEPVQDILARTEDTLWTAFNMSEPLTADCVLLVPEESCLLLATHLNGDMVGGETEELSEDDIERLSKVADGFAHGMNTALSNLSGETLELESCTSTRGALSLPPIFAREKSALEAYFNLTLPEGTVIPVMLLLTPEFVQAVTALMEKDEEGGEQVLGADELAAMLNELEGLESPAPTAAAPSVGGTSSPPFANFPSGPSDGFSGRGLDLLLDIPLDVTVELGRVRMLIKDVLDLASGSIIELDRVAGEPVDLLVNGRLIARGEVVVIEDNFGIRLTEIVSPADRVAGLGKGR